MIVYGLIILGWAPAYVSLILMVLFIIVARCGNILKQRKIEETNEILIHNDLYKMPVNPLSRSNSLAED